MDRINEIETRKAAIVEESKTATGADLDKLTQEMDSLTQETKEIRKSQDETEKRKQIALQLDAGKIKGKKIDNINVKDEGKMENKVDSVEYRKAFMSYVINGAMDEEFRAVSMTADNAAVIPQTVMNTVIEKMEQYGNILPLVRKLSYPAGVVVPTSTLAAAAQWIQEGAAIDQTAKSTAKITFGAFELAAAIGVSFKAHIQSLSAFEAAVAENVARAMVKALESAIVSGDGNAKPMGITNTAVDTKRQVSLSAKLSYTDIVNMIKAIPAAYKSGAVLTMNENTFMNFIGITDANGQPVARTNFDITGDPSYMLLGKKVITTDYLPDLDSAAAGTIVAYAINYDNYILNTAYEMDLYTYMDNPTRNKVYQSVGLYDGKVVDANGLVLISKAGTAASK